MGDHVEPSSVCRILDMTPSELTSNEMPHSLNDDITYEMDSHGLMSLSLQLWCGS
jgi:hypothetical protein